MIHYTPGTSQGDGMVQFEREFLIQLAATWLKCRWWIMGHPLYGGPFELPGSLLGMEDHAAEMRLLCAEVRHGLA